MRIILHGCMGQMGQVLSRYAPEHIIAGVDVREGKMPYPIFPSLHDFTGQADVVIDFSNADAVEKLLIDCVDKRLPCVLCTTGFTKVQKRMILKAAEKIPVLQAENVSFGMNVLLKGLKQMTPLLAEAGFDMEIIEMHHNQKVDVPSGTALLISEPMKQALPEDCRLVCGRTKGNGKRDQKEIGVHAIRGGTIPGIHEILFAGNGETVSLRHTAYAKDIFAEGAIKAAGFLVKQPAGLYHFHDITVGNHS